MNNASSKYRVIVFFLVVLELYVAGVLAVLLVSPGYRDVVASFALPFDLMVFIPALFYFCIVRKYQLSPLYILPVIWLGDAVVMLVAQPQDLTAVAVLTAVTVVVEALIAIREVPRFAKLFLAAKKRSSDPANWAFPTFFELTRNRRAAKLVSLEFTTFYYAFFSWRAKPVIPKGATPFTYYKESSYLAVMAVMLGVMVVELVGMHVLISLWSPEIALVVTIISVYFAFWLLGQMRATVLRPILVDADTLNLNSGMFFSARIPLDAVESIGTADPGLSKKETVNLGMMGAPNCWIVFRKPVETESFTGGKRMTKAVGLTIDQVGAFRRCVQEHSPQLDKKGAGHA